MNILLIRFKLGGGRSNKPWHFSFFKDILAKQGHAVEIIYNQVENYTIEEMINHTIEKGFDLVGTGGIGTVYKPLKKFCSILRLSKPDVKIVVGGHIAADYEFLLNAMPVFKSLNAQNKIKLVKAIGPHKYYPDLMWNNSEELVQQYAA